MRGKSIAKTLLKSSQAALFAGIEIHNKPQISYRYPTTTILVINAWELALKAFVYKFIGKKQVFEHDGKHTKHFTAILGLVREYINKSENNKCFNAIYENLDKLNEYRSSYVHFIGKELDPIIFMLISKAVLNYDVFLKKYFNKDVTKDDDLIILPIGMKLPFNPIDYLKQDYASSHNDFVNCVIKAIKELSDDGIQDSIVIGIDIYADRIRNLKNADIIAALDNTPTAVPLVKTVRITDDPKAPAMRVEPLLPPLTYDDLRKKIKEQKHDILFNNTFNKAMKKIKGNREFCESRYLDPKKKSGLKKEFYTLKAIDAVIEEYELLKCSKQ